MSIIKVLTNKYPPKRTSAQCDNVFISCIISKINHTKVNSYFTTARSDSLWTASGTTDSRQRIIRYPCLLLVLIHTYHVDLLFIHQSDTSFFSLKNFHILCGQITCRCPLTRIRVYFYFVELLRYYNFL